MAKKSLPSRSHAKSTPVVEVTRRVDAFMRLLLAVRAGGVCEFDGCRDNVFEHHVTLDAKNFGEAAHIVAWSEAGPRGYDVSRPADINDIGNLMLLCPKCHKPV